MVGNISNSFGYSLSLGMAKKGAIIFIIDKKFPNKIPDNLKETIFLVKCDIRKENDFKLVCKEIIKKMGRIDVLVNNAGVGYIEKNGNFYPKNKWFKTLEVNLTSAFFCTQEVLRYMVKENYGSIINITSLNSELGFPNNPAYVASKGGLRMLGKAFARDFGKYGIRVNNVAPGYIKTDLTKESYLNKKTRMSREKRIMLGRWGEKNDLLGPCIFLASDASDYITGQDLFVDGGWSSNGLSEE